MAKVIQVRDVPDEVRDALAQAAAEEGLSLSRFVRRELEEIARRRATAAHNRRIIREAQASIGTRVSREEILSALHEGRDERFDFQ